MARSERIQVQRGESLDLVEHDLELSVAGFKSIRERRRLRVAPLTIVSGANSSGKSSFFQPLLLLKQTIEATFDPGVLLINGPNLRFTLQDQLLSKAKSSTSRLKQFTVGMRVGQNARELTFATSGSGLRLAVDEATVGDASLRITDPLTRRAEAQINEQFGEQAREIGTMLWRARGERGQRPSSDYRVNVERNRCFFEPHIEVATSEADSIRFSAGFDAVSWINLAREIIHVPGLRGNPERSYPRTAVEDTFPGTFETYVASVVHALGDRHDRVLSDVIGDLEQLGLTWKLVARRVDDSSVELLVGRMPHAQQGGANDLVSVADVGFGVSQTLPVVLALRVARPGQIVIVEQPEIHLHPRAQVIMARLLVAAAARGVRVISETHSSLLLRSIQTFIARGDLSPSEVSVNWFSRNANDGATDIFTAEVDENGSFGDWPVDFEDVAQAADWEYIEAVSARA